MLVHAIQQGEQFGGLFGQVDIQRLAGTDELQAFEGARAAARQTQNDRWHGRRR